MTGHGKSEWWDKIVEKQRKDAEDNDLEQDENRGQSTPRKAWKFGMYDNNEDGNANP